MPLGWTAANQAQIYTETTATFAAASRDGVFSAGTLDSTERAMVFGGDSGDSFSLFATITDSDLRGLQVSFDVEAWGAFSEAESGGEAAFDVLLSAIADMISEPPGVVPTRRL